MRGPQPKERDLSPKLAPIDPARYRQLPLRAHTLLADVPLHDVWAVDLPGRPEAGILDVRALLTPEALASVGLPVRLLFRLRALLGRWLGWDRAPRAADRPSYAERLSPEERAASLVPTGTPEGPFVTLLVTPRESISEVRNATVHAFLVAALAPVPGGHRLHWAVYVAPVGRITRLYMALIDPFRRFWVYPAILRHVRAAWRRGAR